MVGGRAARSCPWFLNKFSSVVTAKQTSGNRKSAGRRASAMTRRMSATVPHWTRPGPAATQIRVIGARSGIDEVYSMPAPSRRSSATPMASAPAQRSLP